MKIVGREALDRFCAKHAGCRDWISNWLADAADPCRWLSPQDVKDRYASASFLAHNVVIFNVCGNDYRLVTRVAYRTGVVVVLWIGTHAEYSKKYS
jgi:mRNA interferase HigB